MQTQPAEGWGQGEGGQVWLLTGLGKGGRSDFIRVPKTCIFTFLGVGSCVGRKKRRREGGREGGR